MNRRIRELRKTLNLSQRRFAEEIGLKQNAVSYMEKDSGNITEQNIKMICMQFHVNEVWLRTGEGKMFLENGQKHKAFLNIFDQLSPPFQDYMIKSARALLETQLNMQSGTDRNE